MPSHSHGFYCCVDGCKANMRENISFFRCPKVPERNLKRNKITKNATLTEGASVAPSVSAKRENSNNFEVLSSTSIENSMCQQWKDNLGFVGDHKFANVTPEEAYSRIRICSAHFSPDSFSSSGKRLLKTAVPTKFVKEFDGGHNMERHGIPDSSTIQTPLLNFEAPIETDIKEEFMSELTSDITIKHEELRPSQSGLFYPEYVEASTSGIAIKHEGSVQSDVSTQSGLFYPEFVEASSSGIAVKHEESLQSNVPTQSEFYPEYVQASMSGITIKHGQELQSNVSTTTQSEFYPKYVEELNSDITIKDGQKLQSIESTPNQSEFPPKYVEAQKSDPTIKDGQELQSNVSTPTQSGLLPQYMEAPSSGGAKHGQELQSNTPTSTSNQSGFYLKYIEALTSGIINDSQGLKSKASTRTQSGFHPKPVEAQKSGSTIKDGQGLQSNVSTPTQRATGGTTKHGQGLQSNTSTSTLRSFRPKFVEVPTSGITKPPEPLKVDVSIQTGFYQEIMTVPTSGITKPSKPLKMDVSIQTGFYQEIVDDKHCQTPTYLIERLPRIKELKKKTVELQNDLKTYKRRVERPPTLKEVLKFLDENYPAEAIMLIKNQLLLLDKSPQGARYSDEFKQFAFILYLLGPKTYKKLSNIIRLPSRSTLKRITLHWKIDPGFNDFIFNIFELRVPLMSEKSKNCILCIDEMPVKPNLFYNISRDAIVGFEELHNKKSTNIATCALVVMARGISHSWKQPISYFFCTNTTSAEDLTEIIVESIRRLRGIGLNVLAVTSDQEPKFYKLVQGHLKLTIEKPYFYVDNSIIFFLFHVPHLLKSTRNIFFSYNFHLNDGVINKCYLDTMYNVDKAKEYRLAPKLTEEHMNLTNFNKVKVKLAAQVFSHSVAVAMHTYIEFQKLLPEAKTTANFIEDMNKLFDILNSGNLKICEAFTGRSEQLQFLNKMDTIFSNLKVVHKKGIDVTKNLKFIYGWRITISSILKLWEMLRGKNYKFVFTRNLNQDCLENFFIQIRKTRGSAKYPTAMKFSRSFKKLFAVNYFHETEGSSSLEDAPDILFAIPELIKKSVFLSEKSIKNSPPIVSVQTSDYQNLLPNEENSLVYVGEYFLRKCLSKHTCNTCVQFCDGSLGDLAMPRKNFIDYLMFLENIFVSHFNNFCNRSGIGYNMLKQFSDISFEHTCSNFPFDYLISLYTRVRIYYTLKYANKEVKSQRFRKNRHPKLKILQSL